MGGPSPERINSLLFPHPAPPPLPPPPPQEPFSCLAATSFFSLSLPNALKKITGSRPTRHQFFIGKENEARGESPGKMWQGREDGLESPAEVRQLEASRAAGGLPGPLGGSGALGGAGRRGLTRWQSGLGGRAPPTPHFSRRLPHSAHVTFCRLEAHGAARSEETIFTAVQRVGFALNRGSGANSAEQSGEGLGGRDRLFREIW